MQPHTTSKKSQESVLAPACSEDARAEAACRIPEDAEVQKAKPRLGSRKEDRRNQPKQIKISLRTVGSGGVVGVVGTNIGGGQGR